MNYYQHHIGDYIRVTSHLSMLEDAAYRRLLDIYYTNEKPLRGDFDKVCMIVRAKKKQEREAVQRILDHFFVSTTDGWRHEKCDAEIRRYQAGQLQQQARKEGNKERQARCRERRKDQFGDLREHGITPPWNAATEELDLALSCVTAQPVTRDITANQTPETRSQTPLNDDDGVRLELARLEGALRQAGGDALDPNSKDLCVLSVPLAWATEGCDLELDVLPAVRAVAARASPNSVRSWKYFDRAVADAKARRLAPMPKGRINERSHAQSRDGRIRQNYLSGIAAALAEARG